MMQGSTVCRDVWFCQGKGDLELDVYPTSSRVNPVRFTEEREKVLHSICKRLRDLGSLSCWRSNDCDKNIWSWDFPYKELDAYKNV